MTASEVAWVAMWWVGENWRASDKPKIMSHSLESAPSLLPWQTLCELLHGVATSWTPLFSQTSQARALVEWVLLSPRSDSQGSEGCEALAQDLHNLLEVPFQVIPGAFPSVSLDSLVNEVDLQRQDVWIDRENQWLPESRLTAWQSSIGATFRYSGKEMIPPPSGLSPGVEAICQMLEERFGVKYDSVLINMYPDAKSGMRFHQDPQYDTWADEAAVVSVGDTRLFIVREIDNFENRFEYFVRNGDLVLMFGNCQDRYQHCIKVEGNASTRGPRMSLVFKKRIMGTWTETC